MCPIRIRQGVDIPGFVLSSMVHYFDFLWINLRLKPYISPQAFPETLFHQLLLAMVHPDHETRVVSHHIFSSILVPTSVFPHPSLSASDPKASNVPRTLSRAVSVFSSSAVLFEKLRLEKRSSSEKLIQHNKGNISGEIEPVSSNVGIVNRLKSTYGRLPSVNNPPLQLELDEIAANKDNRNSVSLTLII